MQRYFLNSISTEELFLDKEQTHHVLRVMRMRVGNKIEIVLSNQRCGIAEIVSVDNDEVTIQWIADDTTVKELPVNVTVACGLTKGDKFEWVVQKATELGASAFIPLDTAWSVVKWEDKKAHKKIERLQKIAQEAAEQSHRNIVPKVLSLHNVTNIINIFRTYDAVVVAYEEQAKQGEISALKRVFNQLENGGNLLVIFGSEGGLAPKEVEHFVQNGAILCGLGPRILRAETAPLYVLSALSYALELQ